MKTLVISKNQFNMITEDEIRTIHFNSPEEVDKNIIDQADKMYQSYDITVGREMDGVPNVPVKIESDPGDASTSLPEKVNQQLSGESRPEDVTITANVRNGKLEGRMFTKKRIEESRLSRIRKNGYTLTKAELNKMLG